MIGPQPLSKRVICVFLTLSLKEFQSALQTLAIPSANTVNHLFWKMGQGLFPTASLWFPLPAPEPTRCTCSQGVLSPPPPPPLHLSLQPSRRQG